MTPRELKGWRFELEISQTEAAEVLGVSARTVSGWERGEYPVPVAVELACRWLTQAAAAEDKSRSRSI